MQVAIKGFLAFLDVVLLPPLAILLLSGYRVASVHRTWLKENKRVNFAVRICILREVSVVGRDFLLLALATPLLVFVHRLSPLLKVGDCG